MPETSDTRLIEALKKVDEFGDIAPAHIHDPMTMLLRQKVISANFVRWDDDRGQFVLTANGRSWISNRRRSTAKILQFKSKTGCDVQTRLRSV